MDIWGSIKYVFSQPISLDWAILIISLVTAFLAYKSVRYAKKQSMPSLTLVKFNIPLDYPGDRYSHKVVTNNTTVVVRIDRYGYKTFCGDKQEVEQRLDQNSTFIPTDWGQKLIFKKEPSTDKIYYFYVHNINPNKTHYFYPNGYCKSLLKRILYLLCK